MSLGDIAKAPVSLRRAEPEDAQKIRGLILQAHINPTGLAWKRFWVAVDGSGRVVGCCQIKPHPDGSREMASLAVAPECQGLGIARRLIERTLKDQSPPVYLMCRESLKDFYTKFGFSVVMGKDLPPYFRQIKRIFSIFRWLSSGREDLLVMVCPGG
jgi:N-acetylglutamate synthase-like GNAT family acetyltransferase